MGLIPNEPPTLTASEFEHLFNITRGFGVTAAFPLYLSVSGGSMIPNDDCKAAYWLGYDAGLQGKTGDENPFVYVGQHRGIALSAWWGAGFSDQRSGVAQRWLPTKPTWSK